MKRVLLVDDGCTERKYYSGVLEEGGLTVKVAANGYEAWEKALAEAFDVMVVDVNMPKLDGLSLIRILRREGENGEVPVLVLSSEDSPSGRDRALAAGAERYLVKPVSPRVLQAAVIELMEGTP